MVVGSDEELVGGGYLIVAVLVLDGVVVGSETAGDEDVLVSACDVGASVASAEV